MTIKSVRLSITIDRLAADAPIVAQLARDLQTYMRDKHLVRDCGLGFRKIGKNVVVTRDANWIKCAKLSVSIRNLNATAEAIDRLPNLFGVHTRALMCSSRDGVLKKYLRDRSCDKIEQPTLK